MAVPSALQRLLGAHPGLAQAIAKPIQAVTSPMSAVADLVSNTVSFITQPKNVPLKGPAELQPFFQATGTNIGQFLLADIAQSQGKNIITPTGQSITPAQFIDQSIKLPAVPQSPGPTPAIRATGGQPMGVFDDIFSGIQTGINSLTSSQGTTSWLDILNTGGSIALQALAPQPTANYPMTGPAPTAVPSATPVAAASGPALRSVATVGRSFFTRYPNLATAIQRMRNAGQRVTRQRLYSIMKRFGPEFLVTSGLLTAAAINELAMAGPGTRRMNPGNAKALRRACRRVESFHKLCVRADKLRTHRRRKAH